MMQDKTFFFFGWEGFRLRQGASYVYSVPTDAMRDRRFLERAQRSPAR